MGVGIGGKSRWRERRRDARSPLAAHEVHLWDLFVCYLWFSGLSIAQWG